MNKAIIFIDEFKIPHSGVFKVISDIEKQISNTDDKCFIMIYDTGEDVLDYIQKEALFKKMITSTNFEICASDTMKIFKEISSINQEGYDTKLVIVDKTNLEFVKNALRGVKTIVKGVDIYSKYENIINTIIDNNYQAFCEYMPKTLWSEFQHLKEVFNMNKLTEQKEVPMSGIKTRKDLEKYVSGIVEEYMKENASKKLTIKESELKKMVQEILREKLNGSSFNDLHEIKNKAFREINKISKGWLLGVDEILIKDDGKYLIKMFGSGNTKLNFCWKKDADKILSFSCLTSEVLNTDNEDSMKLHNFMCDVANKKDFMLQLLTAITMQFDVFRNSISPNEIDSEIIPNDMGAGMGMDMTPDPVQAPIQPQSPVQAPAPAPELTPDPVKSSAPILNELPIKKGI